MMAMAAAAQPFFRNAPTPLRSSQRWENTDCGLTASVTRARRAAPLSQIELTVLVGHRRLYLILATEEANGRNV